MTTRMIRSTIAFCWTVAAAGALTLALVLGAGGVSSYTDVTFAVLFVGAVVGESFPVRLPFRGGDEEMNLSTPFSFAILLGIGLAPAIVAQVVASVLQDVIARKPAWRTAFNGGQYILALTAAGAVLGAFDFYWRAGAAMWAEIAGAIVSGSVFFAVNFLIVGIAVSTYQRTPLRRHLSSDLKTTMLMAGVSVSLGPLVLAAVHESPLLLGLFVVPFVAVHHSGRLACASAHQALHDALTGLPNRVRFRQLVDEASSDMGDTESFAVTVLDLNRFKEINDTLGHHYGDLLLKEAAARLAEAVGDRNVIARLGGDEFAVLVHGEAPDTVAERLSAALRPVVELDGFLLEVDASMGTAVCPADGTDLDTLLRRADMAMYHAKERHLGHVSYSSGIDEYDPARLALVADLRQGLLNDELVLHYQPKLDLRTRQVVGVEALVRWQHPRLGLLQPGAFVEMAEHTGLIRQLTHYVLQRAIRQCASWRRAGLDLQVAVNVSPRSLQDRSLAEMIVAELETNDVPSGRLELEITETAIMVDPDAALMVLEELAAIGVGLSVDDFGTGYSSLAYLQRLPVDQVKVDRSFVGDLARDGGSRAIVRSIIDLAGNLGLTVVAEGVEDRETLEEIAGLGCDQAQGFFISRPVPQAEIPEHVARWESAARAEAAIPFRATLLARP